MKCFKHNATDAVAICTYCGRALCSDCIQSPTVARIVCSGDCETALARDDEAFHQLSTITNQLLQKSVQSARASAFYCYLCGGLSAGAAVAAWFMLPSPFLIYFTAGCSVVLILSGIWYQRGAKKQVIDAPP